MRVPVCKYHGAGNDFIMLDYQIFASLADPLDFIVKVCDRHTGIGADGLIAVKTDPLEMVYYNQDGSRAPMCGNGIRCFARYCYDHGFDLPNPYPVQTLAGEKIITVLNTDPFQVQVDMGTPKWEPELIGTDEKIWGYPLEIDGQTYTIYSFFMSTVHTVLFCDDALGDIEEVGKKICHHPLFKEQTNVNFVEVQDAGHLKVQTYERGCGVTLACGTGVCASAYAAHALGQANAHTAVQLKKANLEIEIGADDHVFMTGPAQKIIEGEYEYD